MQARSRTWSPDLERCGGCEPLTSILEPLGVLVNDCSHHTLERVARPDAFVRDKPSRRQYEVGPKLQCQPDNERRGKVGEVQRSKDDLGDDGKR